ncbi:hypothetical protein EVAR_94749_1 [Eumeta japonica]|uniref:Uncharacterized protein n=1 Tax=Eumeta variegata TaxID=151549 RepID=A0A4C1UVV5_EUMVA|nr:hypothetical protein EVAR_94749_1 [Eumeta japonica]
MFAFDMLRWEVSKSTTCRLLRLLYLNCIAANFSGLTSIHQMQNHQLPSGGGEARTYFRARNVRGVQYGREGGALRNSCSDTLSIRVSGLVSKSKMPIADITMDDMNDTIWYFDSVKLIN